MMQILAQVQNRFEEVLKQVENLAGANGGELEHKLESVSLISGGSSLFPRLFGVRPLR